MAKAKSVYSCTECGGQTLKWQGQCPHCSAWNTLVETVADKPATRYQPLAEPSRRSFTGDRSLSHSHWGPTPLTMDAARRFVETLESDDLAIHVQSNTSTDEAVLQFIAEGVARR